MSFKFDIKKSTQVLLFLIQSFGGKADIYKIYVILYFADLFHLSRYGTLISGDTYIAMKDGPVPFYILNIYKQVRAESPLKFSGIEINEFFTVKENLLVAKSNYKEDFLSESEVECLFEAIQHHKNETISTLSAKAKDIAWEAAGKNGDILLTDLIISSGVSGKMAEYIMSSFENDINSFNED